MIGKKNNLGNVIFDFDEFETIILQLCDDMINFEIIGKMNLRKLEPKSKRLINRLNVYLNQQNITIYDLLNHMIKPAQNKNNQTFKVVGTSEFFVLMKRIGAVKNDTIKKDLLKLTRYNFKNLYIKVEKLHDLLVLAQTNSYMKSFGTKQRVP